MKHGLTIFQEAGFFSAEVFWIHLAVEHKWPFWSFVLIFIGGIFYARYAGALATDIHNKHVVGKNAASRYLIDSLLVIALFTAGGAVPLLLQNA